MLDNILNNLLSVFNKNFFSDEFPDAWRDFLIFFIPKGNTGKFRPISFAQSLLKLFERMVHRRLTWWIERFEVLSPFQFGFRKRRSCLDNLSILTSSIYSGFLINGYTVVLFFDIKGAFDNVDPDILCIILRDLGLPWNVYKFIYNLTSNRSVFRFLKEKAW